MIAVGLPISTQQTWIEKLPPPIRTWPANYQGLSSAMSNFPVVIVGASTCSCDLFNHRSDENISQKYRKKGWSRGKIERAVDNRKKSNRHAGLNPELRRWLADAATDAGELFVFIHWDSDELNYEQRIFVSAEEIREQTLQLKDEHLIQVKGT